MNLSVIVPLYNEEESLPELAAWIERVTTANSLSYEILMVDDGSTDRSWEVIEGLHAQNPNIKGIKFRRNYGKSAALNTAFQACQGDVAVPSLSAVSPARRQCAAARSSISSGCASACFRTQASVWMS